MNNSIFVVASAVAIWFLSSSHVPLIDYSQRMDQIVLEYTKVLQQEYTLSLVGLGGSMPDDIEKIDIQYDLFGQYDLESARKLYMKIAHGILDRINADNQIRPYLHEYPATLNQLRLSLTFHNESGRYPENKIAFISYVNSRICYRMHNDTNDQFEIVWRETFEEAHNALSHSVDEVVGPSSISSFSG